MFAVWLKALLIFFAAVLFAILAAGLADNTGYILVRWLGWEAQTSVAALFAFLGVLLLLYFLVKPFFRIFFGIFGRTKPL